ncbi:MAG: type II toxin-antitoxin system VapC family toxin, partial [Brachybacterium sp.]
MIYLDTSAAYKLLSRDPGVAEVESLFKDGTPLLSSRLLEVELHATVDRRGGSHADVDEIVARIELDAVDGEVVDHALSLRSGLRVMDALHLSTALLYGEEMTAIATFDRELAETAQQFGLEVRAGRGGCPYVLRQGEARSSLGI